jgi:hypothetical protein
MAESAEAILGNHEESATWFAVRWLLLLTGRTKLAPPEEVMMQKIIRKLVLRRDAIRILMGHQLASVDAAAGGDACKTNVVSGCPVERPISPSPK